MATTSSRSTTPGQPSFSAVAQSELVDVLLLLRLRRAHADAEQRDLGIDRLQPDDQARLRAGAAGGMDEVIDDHAALIGLIDKFERAIGVAERAGRIGAAAGDRVDGLSLGAHLVGHRLHFGVHVEAAAALFRRRAMQVVEKDVAVFLVVRIVRAGPVFEQDMALHAELGRECRGLARMVGLRRALRHDHVGALGLRFGHQEFELARLVAAGGKARCNRRA